MTITNFVSEVLVAHEAAPAAPGFVATSTTSMSIGTGARTFTTQANLAYHPGTRVRLVSNASPSNFMEGVITEYSGSSMSVNSTLIGTGASGTVADWSIVIAGEPGLGDVLSTNNLSELDDVGEAKANLGTAVKFSVFGDSNNDVDDLGQWPLYFLEMTPGINWEPHFCADSGLPASGLAAQYAAHREEVRPKPGQRSIVTEATGTNDLGAGASAEDIVDYRKAVWATMREDGHEVWVQTVRRFSAFGGTGLWTGAYARAEEVNRLIRSDPSLYDKLLEGDVWFPDTKDFRFFGDDEGHMILPGNYLYAQHVARLFQGMQGAMFAPYEARKVNVLNLDPGFEVSQFHGTSPVSLSAGLHTVMDGVEVDIGGSIVVNCSQSTDAPPGFPYSFLMTVTTPQPSLGPTDKLLVNILTPDPKSKAVKFGTPAAEWVTKIYAVKGYTLGDYSFVLRNRAASWSYMVPFTLTTIDKWYYFKVRIPGCINGVWTDPSDFAMLCTITFAAGSAMVGPPNRWSAPYVGVEGMTNGAAAITTFLISSAFLMAGTDEPPDGKLPQLKPDYAEVFEACRRYTRLTKSAHGVAYNTSAARLTIDHQGMAGTPVATATGPLVLSDTFAGFPEQSAANITAMFNDANSGQYDVGNFAGADALVAQRFYELVNISPPIRLDVLTVD